MLFDSAHDLFLKKKINNQPSSQAIWTIACLATVLCNVTQGLAIAVAFAIITVVLREQWYCRSMFDQSIIEFFSRPTFVDVPHTAVGSSEKIPEHVKVGQSIDWIVTKNRFQVLKFDAPLHFANVTKFVDVLQATFNDEVHLWILSMPEGTSK